VLVSATIRTGAALGAHGVDLGLDLLGAHGWLIEGIEPLERHAKPPRGLATLLGVALLQEIRERVLAFMGDQAVLEMKASMGRRSASWSRRGSMLDLLHAAICAIGNAHIMCAPCRLAIVVRKKIR